MVGRFENKCFFLLLLLRISDAVFIGLQNFMQAQNRLISLSKQNQKDNVIALFDNFIMSRSWNAKPGGVFVHQQEGLMADELQFQNMQAELYNLFIGSDCNLNKLRVRIIKNARQLLNSPYAVAGEIDPVNEWPPGDPLHQGMQLQRVLSIAVTFDGALVGQLAVTNKDADYDDHDTKLLKRMAKFYALSMDFLRTGKLNTWITRPVIF